jgi:hypothetical protein
MKLAYLLLATATLLPAASRPGESLNTHPPRRKFKIGTGPES